MQDRDLGLGFTLHRLLGNGAKHELLIHILKGSVPNSEF